jgi:C-terminal processing protease CtpA/Prc
MVLSSILGCRLLEGENGDIGCVLSSGPISGYSGADRNTRPDHAIRVLDYVYVWEARGVNPRSKPALLKGDLITQVDGKDVAGMRFDDVIDMIEGPVGSSVDITVKRVGVAEPLLLHIVRFIPVPMAAPR